MCLGTDAAIDGSDFDGRTAKGMHLSFHFKAPGIKNVGKTPFLDTGW